MYIGIRKIGLAIVLLAAGTVTGEVSAEPLVVSPYPVVVSVDPGSAGERAGIRPGDRIVSFASLAEPPLVRLIRDTTSASNPVHL